MSKLGQRELGFRDSSLRIAATVFVNASLKCLYLALIKMMRNTLQMFRIVYRP